MSNPTQTKIAWIEEFRLSAIPDRLTLANVKDCEPGDNLLLEILTETAIANAQKSQHYTGTPARRLLDNYSNALDGGWYAFGTTIDGEIGQTAIVKLNRPRESSPFKGFRVPTKPAKVIKYDQPAQVAATPILPIVDAETAQEIYKKYTAYPKPGETFWQVVRRCNIPIAITEGLKKALSLIAHGLPAIAARGIYCWHAKGEKSVYQAIGDFATPGRSVYVCFDEDLKPKTVKEVNIQTQQLGKALER